MQIEANDETSDGERGQEKQMERAAVTPDFTDETTREVGQAESLYINTVYVEKKRKWAETECLRVTVEITHPALHLPVYCTWTGNLHMSIILLNRVISLEFRTI